MNAYHAAQKLHHALTTDPLAKAHGADTECALWTTEYAKELGWGTTPIIVWEGGPFEWAVAVTISDSLDSDYRNDLGQGIKDALAEVRVGGFYFEPINSFMLGVYPS